MPCRVSVIQIILQSNRCLCFTCAPICAFSTVRVSGASPELAGAYLYAHRQCLLNLYSRLMRVRSPKSHLCALTFRTLFFPVIFRNYIQKRRPDRTKFSPKRLLFFTHSAQIIFHSVINSTHFNNLTNSYQSRKNRIVQSFRKRFHAIIRSNNHR